MIRCATSLWSADLSNLAAEIRRVEGASDAFHLDVADGHYVHALLFFPDLVKSLRPHTPLPFEVHLMVADPLAWLDDFIEAGADRILFQLDTLSDPLEAIRAVHDRGKSVGLALRVEDPVELAESYWHKIDRLTLIGTALGVKGATMDPGLPDKVRRARELGDRLGGVVDIEVDGGIRKDTVPRLAGAGADWIVPGSLMFHGMPYELRHWLDTLEKD